MGEGERIIEGRDRGVRTASGEQMAGRKGMAERLLSSKARFLLGVEVEDESKPKTRNKEGRSEGGGVQSSGVK